jgi:hypothetical protein
MHAVHRAAYRQMPKPLVFRKIANEAKKFEDVESKMEVSSV